MYASTAELWISYGYSQDFFCVNLTPDELQKVQSFWVTVGLFF